MDEVLGGRDHPAEFEFGILKIENKAHGKSSDSQIIMHLSNLIQYIKRRANDHIGLFLI